MKKGIVLGMLFVMLNGSVSACGCFDGWSEEELSAAESEASGHLADMLDGGPGVHQDARRSKSAGQPGLLMKLWLGLMYANSDR